MAQILTTVVSGFLRLEPKFCTRSKLALLQYIQHISFVSSIFKLKVSKYVIFLHTNVHIYVPISISNLQLYLFTNHIHLLKVMRYQWSLKNFTFLQCNIRLEITLNLA